MPSHRHASNYNDRDDRDRMATRQERIEDHAAFASARTFSTKLKVLLSRTTAAEAIRFAVEEFPAMRSLGAWMRVGDDRFDSDDIQRL